MTEFLTPASSTNSVIVGTTHRAVGRRSILADIDAAWLTAINRRVDEYVSGNTKLVDADEHFAQIRAKLAARDQ